MVATSGIYRIQNAVSGKCYIGSTCDLDRRLKQHFGLLRRGNHHAIHLQRSYTKHGSDAFIWGMLETCEVDKLIEREQHYLDLYKPAFNSVQLAMAPGPGRKAVLQYTLAGEFVKEWTHAQAAADYLGIYQTGIKLSCYGKQPSSCGYYWTFKHGECIEQHIAVPPPTITNYIKPRGRPSGWESAKRKPIMQMDKDGNCIKIWPSLGNCANELGILPGSLCGSMKSVKGLYRGLRFQYA